MLKSLKKFSFDFEEANSFTKGVSVPQAAIMSGVIIGFSLIGGGVPAALRMIGPLLRASTGIIGAGYLIGGTTGGVINIIEEAQKEKVAKAQAEAQAEVQAEPTVQ